MEVVTFGETMVMFSPDSTGPLRYIHKFTKSIAGAESNVAIALARLGHDVGWFSKLGDDEFGRYVEAVIRGEGVDVSRVAIDSQHKTGVLFKERFVHVNPNVYYYRKDSAASQLSVDDLDWDYLKEAMVLHITGVTLALSPLTRAAVSKAIEIAKEHGVIVSFDPNIRLKLWELAEAKPVLLEVARQADLIFPGIDEGKMLLCTDDYQQIVSRFLEMGCKTVAVKLGKEGCYVATQDEAYLVRGYSVERSVDTVGAGDGFVAGFLAGYLQNLSLEECAHFANGVGAMATLVGGDMEGFPTFSQLMEFMGREEYIDR